jgi:hypothetical protein
VGYKVEGFQVMVPALEGSVFWSFDDVERRLVEALQFQWRTESGAWGFASDGPWHLIVRDWWDWAAHEERPVPRIPLSRDQLARMDEASGWLAYAPEPNRKLVVLAVTALAAGRKVVPWRALRRLLRVKPGEDALRKRYAVSITAICKRLNGAEMRA